MIISKGRLIAIGDVHGYFFSLTNLVNKIEPSKKDRIIFLGDYINIGPASRKVLDYLVEFKNKFPQTIFIKGNHEQMFLDYLSGKNKEVFLGNGGYSVLRTYTISGKIVIPEEHAVFIENLIPFHEEGDYVFVHAGFKPGIPIRKNELNTMLWIRREFIESEYNWGKRVVFGHTPFEKPFFAKNKIGINCDVNNNGLLVGCDVENEIFWFSDDRCVQI